MASEAVILAGGFGARLKKRIETLPKPMAPVNGRPFLEYIMDHLLGFGINHFILSTGHLSDIIEDHFGSLYRDTKVTYSREEKPLGTGGAIKRALNLCNTEEVLVVNGDTLFTANINALEELHRKSGADISIALLTLQDKARYGSVVTDESNRIIAFNEKNTSGGRGEINGGIYIINKNVVLSYAQPEQFSIELDFFMPYLRELRIYGYRSDQYFIDIGTPGDYEKAIRELQ
ncbi:MAG TPA: nucleotidyltransferase family protein [Bacteroidales bacterium]|nr:nucleotidyltransferase family protein [Bacteroidales bacterium]